MRRFLSWFADPPSGLDRSARIEKERTADYDILERTQRGKVDVTPWLSWFLEQIAGGL